MVWIHSKDYFGIKCGAALTQSAAIQTTFETARPPFPKRLSVDAPSRSERRFSASSFARANFSRDSLGHRFCFQPDLSLKQPRLRVPEARAGSAVKTHRCTGMCSSPHSARGRGVLDGSDKVSSSSPSPVRHPLCREGEVRGGARQMEIMLLRTLFIISVQSNHGLRHYYESQESRRKTCNLATSSNAVTDIQTSVMNRQMKLRDLISGHDLCPDHPELYVFRSNYVKRIRFR